MTWHNLYALFTLIYGNYFTCTPNRWRKCETLISKRTTNSHHMMIDVRPSRLNYFNSNLIQNKEFLLHSFVCVLKTARQVQLKTNSFCLDTNNCTVLTLSIWLSQILFQNSTSNTIELSDQAKEDTTGTFFVVFISLLSIHSHKIHFTLKKKKLPNENCSPIFKLQLNEN